MNVKKGLMASGVLGALACMWTISAQAVPLSCASIIQNNYVTGSSQCLAGGVNDSNDSAADLNEGDYFGFTDGWVSVAGLNLGANGATSGNWNLTSNLWAAGYTSLVIVLKDGGTNIQAGKGNQPSVSWFAYLLTPGATSGTWQYGSNIFGPAPGSLRQLSHSNLYGRRGGDTVTVPEPASLALFGAGLVGLALSRRRRRAAA